MGTLTAIIMSTVDGSYKGPNADFYLWTDAGDESKPSRCRLHHCRGSHRGSPSVAAVRIEGTVAAVLRHKQS